MATSPNAVGEDVFDQFLTDRGHDIEGTGWERDHNKKQCPECSGLHDPSATTCSVCGWDPHN